MKAYSVDLRRKVVDEVLSGTPKAQVARAFGLGISTVKRYVAKERRARTWTLRGRLARGASSTRPLGGSWSGSSRNGRRRPSHKGASSWNVWPGFRSATPPSAGR
jgi:hypothetical protein